MRRLIALIALVACGCSSAGSDYEKICNAEALSGAAAMTDPSQKAMTVAQWIQENVKAGDAVNVMQALAMAAPDQRGELLKRAAAEAGYTGPCPMADQP
jgi:hypothetical protein